MVADAYQAEGLRGRNLGVENIGKRGVVEGKPQLQNSGDKGLDKTLKGNNTSKLLVQLIQRSSEQSLQTGCHKFPFLFQQTAA